MQARALSADLAGLIGREVHLRGWVHRIRDFGCIRFLILRDRAGQAQVVVPPEVPLGDLNCEWVVAVTGQCRREPRALAGAEVLATRVEPISRAAPPPFDVFSRNAAGKNRLDTLLATGR